MAVSNNSNDYKDKVLQARIPIVPINIDKVNISRKGELIVDFDGKKIMAKRPNSEEIVDLTGDVQEIDKYNNIGVNFTAGSRPLPHRYKFDERSIDSTNKIIKLLNFNEAGPNYIPFKNGDGYLSWNYIFDAIKSNMCRNIITITKGSNDNIVFEPGNMYKTTGLNGNAHVKFLIPETTYSKVIWNLSMGTCNIIFDDNVRFSDSELLKPNSTVSLVMETWDKGATWYVVVENSSYNRTDLDNSISWGYADNGVETLVGIHKIRSTKTLAGYKNSTKNNNTFYFVEETSQIFRGDICFTSPYIICTAFPTTNIAKDKLYFNKTTSELKIYGDNSWLNIITIATDILTANDNDFINKKILLNYINSKISTTPLTDPDITKLISVAGMKSIVKDSITSVNTFDALLPNIGAVKRYITDILPDGTYITNITNNSTIGGITLNLSNGTNADLTINAANGIKSTSTDISKKRIVITKLDNTTVNIDITSILDLISDSGDTIISSETINVGTIGDNVSLNVNISNDEGNNLEARSNGLYMSGGSSLGPGDADKVLISNTNGGISRTECSILDVVNTIIDESKAIPTYAGIRPTEISASNINDYDTTISTSNIVYSKIRFPYDSVEDTKKITNFGTLSTINCISELLDDNNLNSKAITVSENGHFDNTTNTIITELTEDNYNNDIYLYYKYNYTDAAIVDNICMIDNNNAVIDDIRIIYDASTITVYIPVTIEVATSGEITLDSFSYTTSNTVLSEVTFTAHVAYATSIRPVVPTGTFSWKYDYSNINPNDITDPEYLVYIQFTPTIKAYPSLTLSFKLLDYKV